MNYSRNIFIKLKRNFSEFSVFIFFLTLYTVTSSRSIVLGDTGDFLTAAATGDVPHQPGYPLYSLISRLVYLFPFGNHAWNVNLLSAVFASFTLVFTYKIIKLITKSTPSALLGTVSLGIYQSFWFYALVAQIHILHVLLLSILYYFLVLLQTTKNIKYIYFSALVFGLSVSNSQTIIFTIPGILLVLFSMRVKLNTQTFLTAALFAVVGLLPFSYFLWIGEFNPITRWGTINNLSSFLSFFFRNQYGTFNWGAERVWAPFKYSTFTHFFTNLLTTNWYMMPFWGISLTYLTKKNIFFWLIFLGFLFIGPVFYLWMNSPVLSPIISANSEQYLSYSFFFASILAAFGLNILIEKFEIKNITLLSVAVISFFVLPFIVTLPKVRQDNNHLIETYTRFQLSEVPENSILLTTGDSPYFQALYWQSVYGYRKDILVLSNSLMNAKWYRDYVIMKNPNLATVFQNDESVYNELCHQFATKDKLYVSPMNSKLAKQLSDTCSVIPYGLIVKVVPNDDIPEVQTIKDFNDEEWNRFSQLIPSLSIFEDNYSRDRESLFRLGEHIAFWGSYYSKAGKYDWAQLAFQMGRMISPDEVNSIIGEAAILDKNGRTLDAIELLEIGIKREPSAAQLYRNLGEYSYKVQQKNKAYQSFKKYLSFKPNYDPDLIKIRNFVTSFKVSSY